MRVRHLAWTIFLSSMKHTPIFYGEVTDGTLGIYNKDRLKKWVQSLEGEKIELTVKKKRKKRSLPQNSYYWAVIVDILGNQFGYTPDEMHEALKWKFLRLDRDLPTVRSTADLTTGEFIEYIEQIKVWAASEHDCYLPDPNEYEAYTGDIA